jgi:aminoglycoside phosphotransferase (APT) family kinase protein
LGADRLRAEERADLGRPEGLLSGEVAGARAVRDEDAFDVEKVADWLRAQGVAIDGTPEVRQFAGGASNLTYLLRVSTGSTDGPRDLILRRPPTGHKAKSAHDMGREFTIQSRLAPVFPYVAPMVAFCDDESVIGSQFYVMERLVGHIPAVDLPAGVELTADQARSLATNTFDLMIDLHGVDVDAAGLRELGKGEGYVARQVGGWSGRYRKARTPDVGAMEDTMAWLDAHQPADRRTCLIHNDFRMDNIVYAEDDLTRPIGLLDWELATLGDPLMDLGGAIAYWVQADDDAEAQLARMQPSHLPGMPTRSEVFDYYGERTGLEVGERDRVFYEVFGLFRLAVIAQQIYYRYYHGQTTNPRFKDIGVWVGILDRRCQRLIAEAG